MTTGAFKAAACVGKVAFISRSQADQARGRREGSREVYRCRYCAAWHVGTTTAGPLPARQHRASTLFNLRALEAMAEDNLED